METKIENSKMRILTVGFSHKERLSMCWYLLGKKYRRRSSSQNIDSHNPDIPTYDCSRSMFSRISAVTPRLTQKNFFSTQLIRVADTGSISVVSGAWWFAVVAIPLTVLTFLVWKLWLDHTIKMEARKTSIPLNAIENVPQGSGFCNKRAVLWTRGLFGKTFIASDFHSRATIARDQP